MLRAATRVIVEGWSHVAPATTEDGVWTNAHDPDATHFDPLCALERVTSDEDLVCDALEFLDTLAPGGSVTLWNDDPKRTHAEVIRLFNTAAMRAARIEGAP